MRIVSTELAGVLLMTSFLSLGFLRLNEHLVIAWTNNSIPHSLQGPGLVEHTVSRIAWSADGKLLFSRSRGGFNANSKLMTHDLSDAASVFPAWLDTLGIGTTDATLSPDGKTVILTTESGELWCVDLQTYDVRQIDKIAFSPFVSTDVSPDGNLIVATNEHGEVVINDASRGTLIVAMSHRTSNVAQVDFSANARRILAARNDGSVQVWDSQTGDLMHDRPASHQLPGAAAFLPDGVRIASINCDSDLEIWDMTLGSLVWRGDPGLGVQFGKPMLDVSIQGAIAVSGALTRRITLCDANAPHKRREIVNPSVIMNMEFSPDGTLLAVAGHESTIRIYDVRTGQQTRKIETVSQVGTATRI